MYRFTGPEAPTRKYNDYDQLSPMVRTTHRGARMAYGPGCHRRTLCGTVRAVDGQRHVGTVDSCVPIGRPTAPDHQPSLIQTLDRVDKTIATGYGRDCFFFSTVKGVGIIFDRKSIVFNGL